MKKLLLVLVLIKCIAGVPRVDPLVSTPRGLLRGLQGDGYSMFLGVPYAVVDENNPFGPSTPHPGFNSTFEAYNDEVLCIQVSDNIVSGTIQCLQLNVYVPNTAHSGNKLPVMVYFYGGAFVRGNKRRENLSPRFLIRHDVIIVTLNYRVGSYGFLCVSEPGFSNQGLKDQLLGLQWVKDNIESFGGDVNSITLFGQSAGAMSLDLHLLANEGLAQRVILQSGTALTTWLISTQNDSLPITVAKSLGFTGEGIKEAMAFLSGINPIDVTQATNELQKHKVNSLTSPCVEPAGEDALIDDYPNNLQPKVKGMDIMIGHTNQEIMFVYPNSDKDYYANYKFETELLREFDSANDVDIIRHFYVGDEELSEKLQPEILSYGSDFVFNYPTEKTVERYLEAGANRVYRFLFSYEGGRNTMKIQKNLTSDGASHCDDLGYLFDMVLFEGQTPGDEDQRMIDVMTTMWTNFAKFGNPTPSKTDLITVEWKPVEKNRRLFLNIGKPITLGNRVFHDRMAFWEIYHKMHENKVKGYLPYDLI